MPIFCSTCGKIIGCTDLDIKSYCQICKIKPCKKDFRESKNRLNEICFDCM